MSERNGKDLDIRRKTALQGGNMLAAEAVGAVTETAFLSTVDRMDKALPGMAGGMRALFKNLVVRPFRKPLEWCIEHAHGFQSEEAKIGRKQMSEEQRLDALADTTYHYAAASALGGLAMWTTQRALNSAAGVPISTKHQVEVYVKDALLHIGAVGVMGLPQMEGVTGRMKDGASCVFKSLGYDDKKAEQLANYWMLIQVPNGIAWANDVRIMHRLNKQEANGATLHAH